MDTDLGRRADDPPSWRTSRNPRERRERRARVVQPNRHVENAKPRAAPRPRPRPRRNAADNDPTDGERGALL